MGHVARYARPPEPQRGGGVRRLVANLLIAVGIILLSVAAGLWGLAQWRYRVQDRVNRELAVYATVHDEPSDESSDDSQRGPKVDWEGLKAVNDEVVGWLQVPGTSINYPVYQGTDNEHYLRHSAKGEWTVGGQLFLDCDNTPPGMVDSLSLVYGHQMFDGSMFDRIGEMHDQESFDAIDTVWYATEQKSWECEPLFVFLAQEDDQAVRTFAWESKEAFRSFLAERLATAPAARADAAELIARTDHVLCLITCNYLQAYGGHGRTILVCVPKEAS